MAHAPHELSEEFPEHAEKIHTLKLENAHFAKLVTEYHNVNREIHRLEERIEAGGEAREENLRKERLKLKDEIAALLSAC